MLPSPCPTSDSDDEVRSQWETEITDDSRAVKTVMKWSAADGWQYPLPPHQLCSTVLTARAGFTGHGKQYENPHKGSFFLGMQSVHANKCLNGRQSLKDILVLFPLAVIKIPWQKPFRREGVNFHSQGITVHHHGNRSTRLDPYTHTVSTARSAEE